MRILRSVEELRAFRSLLDQKKSLGFVPTMGALHEGHGELIQQSVKNNDVSLVSIFVNPTQFNNKKDLESYPEDHDRDIELAEQQGAELVFLPSYTELYADDFSYQINESSFSEELCGVDRPGHFTGVLTVVMKLLNLVVPTRAYFGLKDYQQFELVKGMCEAFFLPIEIVGVETVRDLDGLALSSRNKLLSPEGRELAKKLNKILSSNETDESVRDALEGEGFSVDYVQLRGDRRFAAVHAPGYTHPVRLIDNVQMESLK